MTEKQVSQKISSFLCFRSNMNEIKCPKCGEQITDERIEAAVNYAHDCGFDEGYEAARDEYEAQEETNNERRN